MLPYRDSRLTYITLAIFFVLLLGYAAFEAQGILFGPRIAVTSNVTEVSEPFIVIKGQAERIAALTMNGNAVSVTETGSFEQPYLLAPGYNRITLEAHDRYGHRTSSLLEIVYTPTDAGAVIGTSTSPAAGSSTGAVAP